MKYFFLPLYSAFAGKGRGLFEFCGYPHLLKTCDGEVRYQAQEPVASENCPYAYGIFPHKTSCAKYWQCWNGTASEQVEFIVFGPVEGKSFVICNFCRECSSVIICIFFFESRNVASNCSTTKRFQAAITQAMWKAARSIVSIFKTSTLSKCQNVVNTFNESALFIGPIDLYGHYIKVELLSIFYRIEFAV